MRIELTFHPVATLFPDMSATDYAALVEDIRRNGVKVPILVHGGEILDGRHRYRACRELGKPCPAVEWNGSDPWLEVQSRNLLRRHLAKDQTYAIRKMAAERFPQIAAPIQAAKVDALKRKAQAKGERRGTKALLRSQDRQRESADVIGAQVGVSGATVKRVERLARVAPDLLPKVAAGEFSVKRALRVALAREEAAREEAPAEAHDYFIEPVLLRIRRVVETEWSKCPCEYRMQLLDALQQKVRELIEEGTAEHFPRASGDDDQARVALHLG